MTGALNVAVTPVWVANSVVASAPVLMDDAMKICIALASRALWATTVVSTLNEVV